MKILAMWAEIFDMCLCTYETHVFSSKLGYVNCP